MAPEQVLHTFIFANIKGTSTHKARTACLFAAQLGPWSGRLKHLLMTPAPKGFAYYEPKRHTVTSEGLGAAIQKPPGTSPWIEQDVMPCSMNMAVKIHITESLRGQYNGFGPCL